jgi:hypothetical protein
MTSSNQWSDSNALAGPLQSVLGMEVTTAVGHCSGCGRTGPMAEVRVFDHPRGWSPAARPATRSCCGWYTTAAAPGWTCTA